MKNPAFFILIAVIAAVSMIFSGCSDDDDSGIRFSYPGNPNTTVMNQFASTVEPIVYQVRYPRRYLHKVDGKKNRWEEYDILSRTTPNYEGVAPSKIIFRDGGKVDVEVWAYYYGSWIECQWKSDDDRLIWRYYMNKLSRLWQIYCFLDGVQNVYFTTDFDYDSANKNIRFEDNIYGVIKCEEDELVLSTMGDVTRVWEFYDRIYDVEGEESKHVFGTSIEAFKYVYQCVHEKFGDEYDPENLDVPIGFKNWHINIKEIGEWLDTFEE